MAREVAAAPEIVGRVVLAAGGYDAALAGIDAARVGCAVRVRQLDHHDEGMAHEILTDIMAGQAARLFSSSIRYKGKRPGYWLGCVAPEALAPRYFGLFSPAGELVGWFSIMFTLARPDLASFGILLRPPWRDKGIGTAATRLAVAGKDVLLARPIGTLLVMTSNNNARMLRIVEKIGLVDLGSLHDAGTGQARRAFATSHVTFKAARDPADPTATAR